MRFNKVGPPAAGVEELDIDGSVSLYQPTIDKAIVLNDTASDVWRLCTGEHTLEEIVTLLAAAYEVDKVRIRDDVEEAVRRLETHGALVIHSEL